MVYRVEFLTSKSLVYITSHSTEVGKVEVKQSGDGSREIWHGVSASEVRIGVKQQRGHRELSKQRRNNFLIVTRRWTIYLLNLYS